MWFFPSSFDRSSANGVYAATIEREFTILVKHAGLGWIPNGGAGY